MRPPREDILAAFCAAVFGSTEFRTTGRRLIHWSKIADQPACFVRHIGDRYEYSDIEYPKLTMHLEIWLYVKSSLADPDASPSQVLNPIIEAVEATMLADDPQRAPFTLDGLVAHAWIEGESEIDPGDLDDQAKAILPVHILVP